VSQELRNKIYAVATAAFGILLVLGVWDQVAADEATRLLDAVLAIVPEIIGLFTSLTAFVKSLPSRVATVGVPKNEVEGVLLAGGTVLAGPASTLPDGTIISAPSDSEE
jgi:hypothetical protein